MGWAALLLLGVAAMAAMVVFRLPRPLWSFVGAALMLGAAGYALQGRPGLVASPAVVAKAAVEDDAGLIELREAMFGRFTADGQYLVAADAMTRAGDEAAAARWALAGIQHVPQSAQLWTGLGTALAAHDGVVSPSARFAFDQATRLAPRHPGPSFFFGLAEVRAGNFPAARRHWARALMLTPTGAPYRPEIEGRLVLLDQVLTTSKRQ